MTYSGLNLNVKRINALNKNKEENIRHYKQVRAKEKADIKLQEDLDKAKTPQQKRNIRSRVPIDVEEWLQDNQKIQEEWGSNEAGFKAYRKWLTAGKLEKLIDRSETGKQLSEGVEAHTEHAISLKGAKEKQTGATPTQYGGVVSGSDDPTAKFTGSAYFNVHQGATDAFTSKQMEELQLPKNWHESASYFFAFGKDNKNRLTNSQWLALQQGEVTVDQLKSIEGVEIDDDHVKMIERIHEGEIVKSKRDKYSPESTSHKKISEKNLQIEDLMNVHPRFFETKKLPPSPEEKFQADILAKNPLFVDTRGLKRNKSSAQTYFNRIKSHLQSKGFQREAARVAGQSNIPWVNVSGDFVGAIYDGLAVAANPTDKQAIVDFFLSGTQAITSGVGTALILIPDPATSGLGFLVMKAGDQVGKIERLWNIQREAVAIGTGKIRLEDIRQRFTAGDPGATKNLLNIKQNRVTKISN